MKKDKEATGYITSGISHPSRPDLHYLTGFPNKNGYVVFRHATDDNFLIFQQDKDNNITAEIEIPTKELKNLAIWILRGIK